MTGFCQVLKFKNIKIKHLNKISLYLKFDYTRVKHASFLLLFYGDRTSSYKSLNILFSIISHTLKCTHLNRKNDNVAFLSMDYFKICIFWKKLFSHINRLLIFLYWKIHWLSINYWYKHNYFIWINIEYRTDPT